MLLDRGLLAREGGVYRDDGRRRRAGRPGDAPGSHRRPARRARSRGAAALAGRLRSREDLYARGACRARRASTSRSSSRCSPRSCARRCSAVQADPRSPERGQYGFLQDLVRRVAYETLARRERRSRHLAAAAQLEASFGTVGAGDRRGGRVALPGGVRGAARRRRRRARSRNARVSCSPVPEIAPARWQRRPRRGATTSRPPRSRTIRSRRPGYSSRPVGWPHQNVEFDDANRLFTAALGLLEAAGEDARSSTGLRLARVCRVPPDRHRGARSSCLEGAFAAGCRRRAGRRYRRFGGQVRAAPRSSPATSTVVVSRSSSRSKSRRSSGCRTRSAGRCSSRVSLQRARAGRRRRSR